MAEYEKYLTEPNQYPEYIVALAREIRWWRKFIWLNHGHKGMYGDDGEMQCAECRNKYGFWDWKRVDIDELQQKLMENILKIASQTINEE